ncbi:unnamed protein product [Cuscuta campestris]|uniref:Uncharacterized protein n=1 Tax=Cuscuta campestris TaxID=132261 RepID=A0A484NBG1_9ASTE|nr:unnamed protein product [Cuscuta campestris]
MKNSPINSKLEQHHQHYEFDPHSDFEQFLAEGRNHARRVTLGVTSHLQESSRLRKTVSGPITNLFSGEDKDAKEIVPYICLGKMNTPKTPYAHFLIGGAEDVWAAAEAEPFGGVKVEQEYTGHH